jgi:sec-independent protein translocase protein TatC
MSTPPPFSPPPREPEIEEEHPFLSHLVELRHRLLRCLGAIAVVCLGLLYFANDLYEILAVPLMRQLPEGGAMIATKVTGPFFAPFKLTIVVAVFACVPYLLYQAWAFVAPGLYRHERRLVLPLLISSSALFYLGTAFAYYVAFPLIFAFFASTAPPGVKVMTDINDYLDFVLAMFLAFGLAFEVPIATLILVHSGIVSRAALEEKRPYLIVGAFVVGAILTPPDVVSQCLLSVPLWLLFEAGLFLCRFLTPPPALPPPNDQPGTP